jgi:crossover junction endodeoxyribonuclease RuvC
VERVFSQHNVRTVMGTAQAGAVAVLCAARRGLPVALHTPSEVKAAVTGSGRADKAQVTTMVMRLLRMVDPPKPADTADALALAICHLWRGGAQSRLAAAAAAVRAAGAMESGSVRAAGAMESEAVRAAGAMESEAAGAMESGAVRAASAASAMESAAERAIILTTSGDLR